MRHKKSLIFCLHVSYRISHVEQSLAKNNAIFKAKFKWRNMKRVNEASYAHEIFSSLSNNHRRSRDIVNNAKCDFVPSQGRLMMALLLLTAHYGPIYRWENSLSTHTYKWHLDLVLIQEVTFNCRPFKKGKEVLGSSRPVAPMLHAQWSFCIQLHSLATEPSASMYDELC